MPMKMKKRTTTKKPKTTRKPRAPNTKAITAIVKKTLMKTAETKFVSSYATDANPNVYNSFNSVISGSTQFSGCLPSVIPGTGEYNRIGNLIQPISNKVALDVRFRAGNPAAPIPHDVTVVIYYGVCKKYKYYPDLSADSTNLCLQLLSSGGLSAISSTETQEFGGIQSDSHLPVNTAIWKLKKKTFRLYKCAGVTNGIAGAGVTAPLSKTNHTCILDFSSFLPSKLKYDQDLDQDPSNYAPVWAMGYYYNDTTPPDTGSGILEFKQNAMLLYKDI